MNIKRKLFLQCVKAKIFYVGIVSFFLGVSNSGYAQNNYTIKGVFASCKENEVRLIGYDGTKERLLQETQTDAQGNLTLDYPKKYVGAATLQIKDRTSVHLLVNQENVEIVWSQLDKLDSLRFVESKENQWFQQGFAVNNKAQSKLLGITYLLPLYQNQEDKQAVLSTLQAEVVDQSQQLNAFIAQLPKSSYAKKYLAYRAILQEFQSKSKNANALQAPEKILLDIDYGEMEWYHSGLIKEIFDGYLNYSIQLSNKATILANGKALNERVKETAKNNPVALNDYSEYLIKQYERYGLTELAASLAVSVLEDTRCLVEDKRAAIFEQYRKMAVGKTAPNVALSATTKYKKLYDIPSKYKVVVFGASWCEACEKEIPQLKEYTNFFKENYDAEIIFFALDTDKAKYETFAKDLPFIKSCDFKGWESAAAKAYCIFASPTIYILDKSNTIVAKPLSSVDAAAWLYKNKENTMKSTE